MHGNEELVGEALKPYRDKIVLATKLGIHFDMSSSEPNFCKLKKIRDAHILFPLSH